LNQYNPEAPGYLVKFKDGVNTAQAAQTLAQKYGFTPVYIWEALGGFATPDLPRETIAQLRCEPVIDYMEYNGTAVLL